jgi:O-antigen/teichoic acid export membrane protein
MSSRGCWRARSPAKAGSGLAEPAAPIAPAQGELAATDADSAALAKGGRTSVFGFILRLIARLPFLYFAGRWYGPEIAGRFAYAVLVVEFAAQLATLGLKRGLAQAMSQTTDEADHPGIVWDAMALAAFASLLLAGGLMLVPQMMFPGSAINGFDYLLPLIVVAVAGTDIALAALAYRYDIGASVRARAIVEPWAISIAAGALAFYSLRDGLILSYVIAMLAAFVTAMIPLLRSYGPPRDWRLNPGRLISLARDNLPLAGADAAEWGSRRLDLAVLGLFAGPAVLGIYYMAQQVASLPQKLKTSFEPILGPVISRGVNEGRLSDVARQVAQVGFWVLAAQVGVGLALGIPAEAIMGLAGPEFVVGAAALIFLLFAEVVASTAVTSEAALVYMAPRRNLVISLGMITLQAALSVLLCTIVVRMGWPPIMLAAAVALALTLALGAASLVKARLLTRLAGERVHGWRPAILSAAAAAVVVGWLATQLPEWAELVIGVPAILGAYCWLIWTRGFGPADRALLKSGKGD